MTIHELKISPKYFWDVFNDKKNFELRKDDRDYKIGDLITLREYENGEYTGREIKNIPIGYILRDVPEYGLREGYCILGFQKGGERISKQKVLSTLDFVDKALDEERTVEKYKELLTECIKVLPTVQPEPISEEYAKAVKSWLVDYQVKSAELHGRYTPYEVLGWIVNDWRRDNEVW